MNKLTFDQLSEANRTRCEQSFHPCDDWSLTDWATALGGETGEALNLIKKLRRGEPIEHTEIGKEIADIVIYADLLAQRLDLNLSDIIAQKFNEVSERVNSPIRLPEECIVHGCKDEATHGAMCYIHNNGVCDANAESEVVKSYPEK